MNRHAEPAQQPARVVVRRADDKGTQAPPADHEDWKHSQTVGFENLRRILQKRRKK